MGLLSKFETWITPKKALLLILLLGFLVYANSIPNGFVWDDEEQIVKNAIIQDLGNIGEILSGATFQTGGAGLSGYFFRPLITFTFMINYFFWGENAFGFHLFQVLFHLLNAFLIFKILTLLLPAEMRLKRAAALSLSLVFAVHPAINEGVVYIAAVSELMFTFFILLALFLVIKTENIKPGFKKISAVLSLLLAAMLYKEPAVIGPPILAAYLFLYKAKFRLRWTVYLAGLFLFSFFFRLVIIQTPIQHPLYSDISEASLIQRLMTIPKVLFHYLSLLVYPEKLAVSQHFVVRDFNLKDFILPLIASFGLFFAAVYAAFKTRSRLMYFGIIWLIISFGPVLNIIPLDMTVAERWLYFPFIGFVLLAAGVLSLFEYKKTAVIIFALLISLIPLSIRTVIRNTDWKDGLTLYSRDAIKNTNSFDLENNLGVELFRAGRINEAKIHFEKSLSIQPKWHFALNNLGATYQNLGDLEKAKEQYGKVLETSDYYLAHENLVAIYLQEENYQLAKETAEKALMKLPQNGVLWRSLALAEYKLGNKENALKAADNAYLLLPDGQSAYIYSALQQGRELEFEK
jgi:protein O-mannosyl-transferase